MASFTPADPMKELFWAAVVNGVVAVPIMAAMMLPAGPSNIMPEHVIGPRLKWAVWAATAAMGAAVVGLAFVPA